MSDVTSDLASRVAAGFRDARSRLDEQEREANEALDDLAVAAELEAAVSTSRRQLDALEQIAGLHRDNGGDCWNCDYSDWPCPTFYMVAAGLGIDTEENP
jgi:hypothetical protein